MHSIANIVITTTTNLKNMSPLAAATATPAYDEPQVARYLKETNVKLLHFKGSNSNSWVTYSVCIYIYIYIYIKAMYTQIPPTRIFPKVGLQGCTDRCKACVSLTPSKTSIGCLNSLLSEGTPS